MKFYEDLIVKHETETHHMKFYYLALNCADFEKLYKRSKLCGGPDSFTQVNHHKKIYDQSLKFRNRCNNVNNFDVFDTPPVICERVMKIINEYM